MMFARLLGLGAVYGLAFVLIKSIFPEPFILLVLQGGESSEGNLTVLGLSYLGAGLVGGVISGPLFGGILLLLRRRSAGEPAPAAVASSFQRLALSLALALLMGLISALLILLAYATGMLPGGGVLDPLSLIQSSNFPAGTPLLVAWTIARDLLPAGLTGLFLSPVGGGPLFRFYTAGRPPTQKTYEDWEGDF